MRVREGEGREEKREGAGGRGREGGRWDREIETKGVGTEGER